MQRDSSHNNRCFDISTTYEDESYFSSSLDQLNPRVTRSSRKSQRQVLTNNNNGLNLFKLPPKILRYRHLFDNNHTVADKFFAEKSDNVTTPRYNFNIGTSASNIYSNKCEPLTIFGGKYPSEIGKFDDKVNEKSWHLMHCANNRKRNSTPRIIRVIRKNNKRSDSQINRTIISRRARLGSSKSSIILLYHGKPITPPSSSSKTHVRFSRSDETVVKAPQIEVAHFASSDRAKIVESPETSSPRYLLPRRKNTSKKYHHASRRQHSLNLNIFHEAQAKRIVPPLRDHCSAPERQTELWNKESRCIANLFKNPFKSCERRIAYHSKGNVRNRISSKYIQERISNKPYSPIDVTVLNPINYHSKQVEAGDANNQKQSASYSNLDFLMQIHPKQINNNQTFISINEGNELNRVFPFQATPSGNLKIVPNQVVFESKKVSVVVADPQHTKVNIKTELNRGGLEIERFVSDCSNQTTYIDLPSNVTPSTIAPLKTQKKSPYIEENYNLHMQSYNTKCSPAKMEQKQSIQSTSNQFSSMNDVPLSSLGFTNEQPIDWSDIILPEKTDLYQELARRITNYKNADCIVRIDHDEFYCHLVVLQSYSTFFDEKNRKDIDLSGTSVTSKAFAIIYDWMINSIHESHKLLQRDNILEIFTAAQYLGIKELEEQCWAFIDNDELFSEDTAFLLYLEAKNIGNIAVMELMVPRIMKFFLMLVSTKDFLELSVDELCLLLKSNYICVNSEMEVLMSAVRWLMHDWNTRKQYMLEVLKCIRFGLIAPWQLVDVKRNPENPEFMELMSYPEVQKMVDDGLAFVIIKYWYGDQTEDYYHWIELLGLSEPTNRNWAGEDKNYITYREFLLYLEEYQKTKISEIKIRKLSTKPPPPNSPPCLSKDGISLTPERTCTDCSQNHCCVNSHSLEQYSTIQNRRVKKRIPKGAVSSGFAFPSEILTEGLSGINKNSYVQMKKEECDANNSNIHDATFCGAGESPRRSLDFLKNVKYTNEHHQRKIPMVADKHHHEDRQNKNVSDAYNCKHPKQKIISSMKKQQMVTKNLRYPEDSAKSEDEAATMIQATYRGYKVRRNFHEIKKSSSDEKQNAKKVAELFCAICADKPMRFVVSKTVRDSQSI